jgi:hypothetical protein
VFRKLTIYCAVISGSIVSAAYAQSTAVSGLYQIVSGTNISCCGIGGSTRTPLPDQRQSFVRLTLNSQGGDATMTFLGQDMNTIFSVQGCPSGRIPFSFDHGFASSDQIVFFANRWYYNVSNSADTLRINGTLMFDSRFCSDLPNRFTHTNVVAVLMSSAAIRVSEVEICWDTVSNRTYQVQYRSTLTSNVWTNLGPPHKGDGSNDCIADRVLPGQPQRYYRILTLPQ